MNRLKPSILSALCALLLPALASALQAGDLPLTLTDALGDTVTLKAYPQRIVSLAPSNTELLFAAGAGDRVVGVTEYCDHPPEAARKTKIGGFSNPSLEQIVALQPDLVLAARFNPLDVLEGLRRLDIPVFALAPKTLEEVLQTLRQIGRLSGQEEAAQKSEAALRARVEAVRKTVEDLSASARLRVLWGQLKAPMYTAGPGSFIDDLIRLAGGINIAADAGSGWPQIGLETLVDRNPQAIVVSSGREQIEKDLVRLRQTSGWKTVDAIESGRVYHLDLNLLGRPGPRLVDGLEALARILHPDRFPQ